MSRMTWIGMLAVVWMLAGAAQSAVAAEPPAKSDDATARHSFKDVERWAKEFEAPDRKDWQQPGIVMRVLGVDEGESVADLGAGTGYFTHILSIAVGAAGRVWAVDVEPAMLDYIAKRADLGPGKVTTVLATPDDPKLPAGEVDLVLAVDTWHHIDDRLAYLKRLAGVLSPNGRVAIVDWHEGELPLGPPAGHKLSREAVLDEFARAGWRLESESVALPYQYLLVFYPPGT